MTTRQFIADLIALEHVEFAQGNVRGLAD